MKRIVIAAVIGGVVLFAWGFVSWVVLPWHRMEKLPEQARIAQVMRDAKVPSGAYHLPWMDEDPNATAEQKAQEKEAFDAAHEEGPIALIMYKAEGSSPMGIMSLVVGLVLDIVVAGIAAVLVAMAGPALGGFLGRVIFVLVLGLYVAVGTNLMNWNFMEYPFKFSVQMAADTMVASLLLGIVLAILIRPDGMGIGDDMTDFEVQAG